MREKLSILLMFFTLSADVLANAQRGLEIARKVDKADSGWGDEQVTTEMTLISETGKEVKRYTRTKSLEGSSEGDKSLVIFDRPRDVKGTVFLTYAKKVGNDDQWLFLPALKRVKRISSSNRSGPFMGSEFSYEDISSEEVERYKYKYLKDDKCGKNLDCYVYERYPVDENSGYSKQIVYADKTHLRIHKVEYFDRKKSHLKTLSRTDYQKFGNVWRANTWTMVNHLRNKKTIVIWKDRKFKTGLTSADFDKSAIKRFR